MTVRKHCGHCGCELDGHVSEDDCDGSCSCHDFWFSLDDDDPPRHLAVIEGEAPHA